MPTTIHVQEQAITVISHNESDYISLTDMVRNQMQEHVIFRWLSLKSTIEYLGEWEALYNPNFNYTEFGTIRNMAGSNNFVLSVKTWVERTGAVGIISKAGRYGGTYAHRDLAYHFGMWISPRFQLLLVKEYQRLKEDEQKQLGWSAKRELSNMKKHPVDVSIAKRRTNHIHTDAVRANLVPDEVDAYHSSLIYAEEADVLNVKKVQWTFDSEAENKNFGMTAKEWREANPGKKGNMRDYATINQLICLSNMEYPKMEPNTFENRNNTVRNLNAVFINEGIPQRDRLHKLNKIAIQQMSVLEEVGNRKLLK